MFDKKIPIKQTSKTDLVFENQADEWLTTKQAALYLKVSEGSLRNMTSNGHVIHYKLGRRTRYRLIDLRNLLISQKRGGSYGN